MPPHTVQLWDPLIRLFHWSLAIIFFANYFFTEPGESWHQWLGYVAVAWLVVRVLWGFLGKGAALWSDFFPTRATLGSHITGLLKRESYHRLGHSPLGALIMIIMMLCIFLLGITGFMMQEIDYFWGIDWVEDLHELISNALMGFVGIHLFAAIYESIRLKENLPLSMITGKRQKSTDRLE